MWRIRYMTDRERRHGKTRTEAWNEVQAMLSDYQTKCTTWDIIFPRTQYDEVSKELRQTLEENLRQRSLPTAEITLRQTLAENPDVIPDDIVIIDPTAPQVRRAPTILEDDEAEFDLFG